MQRDDAFVLWDDIPFDDQTGATLNTAPEWVRRTICCARWELEHASEELKDEKAPKPRVVLAVYLPPLRPCWRPRTPLLSPLPLCLFPHLSRTGTSLVLPQPSFPVGLQKPESKSSKSALRPLILPMEGAAMHPPRPAVRAMATGVLEKRSVRSACSLDEAAATRVARRRGPGLHPWPQALDSSRGRKRS